MGSVSVRAEDVCGVGHHLVDSGATYFQAQEGTPQALERLPREHSQVLKERMLLNPQEDQRGTDDFKAVACW